MGLTKINERVDWETEQKGEGMNIITGSLIIGFVLAIIFVCFCPHRYSWGKRIISFDIVRVIFTPLISLEFALYGFHWRWYSKEFYWIGALFGSLTLLILWEVLSRKLSKIFERGEG